MSDDVKSDTTRLDLTNSCKSCDIPISESTRNTAYLSVAIMTVLLVVTFAIWFSRFVINPDM